MILTLQTHGNQTLEEVRRFLSGNEAVDFVLSDLVSSYSFIVETLVKFRYRALPRRDKGSIRAYLMKMTGKSESQVTRLIRQYLDTGRIRDRRGAVDHAFHRRYAKADIGLLAEVDEALDQLTFKKTRGTGVSIGERRKPKPKGRPGFLRVDTVHQGDKDGEKGVYHVNLVDEVTQWEHVATVRAISDRCLVPVLEELISACPFQVLGFHADNSAEYINHRVAEMLNGLHVPEFTKSRPRHSNDNALVESKNGNVIRRHFGYGHIPKPFAPEVNVFARDTLSPFLNFHHPCLFTSEVTDTKGRTRKRYRYQDVMTRSRSSGPCPKSSTTSRPA